MNLAAAQARGVAARRSSRRLSCVNPTTCEREYSDPELEYLRAVEAYRRRHGVRFPTACEYRNILLSLGYVKS